MERKIDIKEKDMSARDQFKEILEKVGGVENIKEVRRNSNAINVTLKDLGNSNLSPLQDLTDIKEVVFDPDRPEEFKIVFIANLAEIYDNLFKRVL